MSERGYDQLNVVSELDRAKDLTNADELGAIWAKLEGRNLKPDDIEKEVRDRVKLPKEELNGLINRARNIAIKFRGVTEH